MSHQVLIILAVALGLVGGLSVMAVSLKRRKAGLSGILKVPENLKNFVWYEWGMFAVVIGAALVLFWNAIAEDTTPVSGNGCPVDTHICPDGSYVSRAGPHCIFSPCGGAGAVSDLDGAKDVSETPSEASPQSQKAEIKAEQGQVDNGDQLEAEPVVDKTTPDQIDVETCQKDAHAGMMQGGHPIVFSVETTRSNLCVIKVVRYTDDGGSSYMCEFRMRGLPEQGFEKYFKISTFESIREKMCSEDNSDLLSLYRLAAARGNAVAEYNVAKYYDQRHGITEDFPEASKWYRKAAEQGHVGAEYNLGLFYQQGLGVGQNAAEAGKWFLKAAEQGMPEAEYSLGVMYDRGSGVTQDQKEASDWYRKAADQGNADAQSALGDLYYSGHGVAQSYDAAYFWYIVAATSNNKDYVDRREKVIKLALVPFAKAQEIQKRAAEWRPKTALGAPVPAPLTPPPIAPVAAPAPAPAPVPAPPPPPKVVAAPAPAPPPAPAPAPEPPAEQPLPKDLPSLEALANQGNAAAEYAMALHYSSGNPLVDDVDRAAQWYLKAAQQGNAKAQYVMGLFYDQGRGVAKNDQEAFNWYNKAAAQGIPTAQYMLGYFYHLGRGVKQDDTAAAKWMSEAAEVGIVGAQYQMGLLYMAGKGVDRSDSEAYDLFKRAAEQGDDNAQYSVATMLISGSEDVPRDLANAYFWLCLSANSRNQGENQKRAELRDKLERQIPSKEATDLKKRAMTWKPTIERIKY